MEERKWDYQGSYLQSQHQGILQKLNSSLAFGFVATLLESLPIVGLGFSISNRVGAAMWAHDLEKQQHFYASGQALRVSPPSL